jgi:predicted phage terminase large subunit-like protein
MPSLRVSPEQAALELLRRRKARADLIAYANAIDVPGKPVSEDPDEWLFQPIETGVAAHHALMLSAIQRTVERPHGRLMLAFPPGSAKSSYASVVAPTWYMGRNPGGKIILASYGSDLAKRHGRRARQIVKQSAYRGIFGTGISSVTSAADEWALENGSEYLAGGLLSGLTGSRANGIVIDDPVKGREDAESEVMRKKTREAYDDDLMTRLIPGGWVILVMTRWHEADLAGSILPKHYNGESGMIECRDGNTWEVLNVPACAEREDDPLGRKPGEYLWPEWFTDKHWAQFRSNSRTWASLFQQRPRPAEGVMFKQEWLRRYGVMPAHATYCVHSWDTAYKPNQINDPSVGTSWGFGSGSPGCFLRDVYRGRIEYPALRRNVISWAERDRPIAILIEDKASGQSLIQELRSTTSLPIIAIEPDGDKVTRANEVSAMFEAGLVYLPETAPWLVDYEAELLGFPLAAHDDQVDSTTQFLRWVRGWSARLETASTGSGLAVQEAGYQLHGQIDNGYGSVSSGSSTEGF